MQDKLGCLNTEESLKILNSEKEELVSELLERSKLYFRQKPDEVGPMRDIGAVTKTPESVTGLKYDGGKPKISLIPIEAINEMAASFTYGAEKYSSDNFKTGLSYRRLLDAALRHILAVANNEDLDEESGLPHLGNALASLAMLSYMMKNKPEFDDRYKGGTTPQK